MSIKDKIENLAIFGGTPMFVDKIYVGRPNVGNREQLFNRLNLILDRNYLTNDGPCVHELERKLASFLGVKNCVLVCNATVGLEIAVRALGLSGEVIIPSMTFIATAHALQWQNITPIFCDINLNTWNIDPSRIEELITPQTTGIIGVHLFGRPCNTDILAQISSKHNLKLMYDAAHAFGCSCGGKMIGNFGDAEVFSFHATKFFNSLEGGAITTNDDELAKKIRLMRNFGFSGHDDNVLSIGTNGKMNEFSAAMGLTSLENLSNFIEVNRLNYNKYLLELSNTPGINLINYNTVEKNNFQYIVIDIDYNLAGISRDQLLKILLTENIIVRRYFYPGCHRSEPYRSRQDKQNNLEITEDVADRLLSLPTGTGINDLEIKKICDLIKYCVSNSAEINLKFIHN